MGIKMAYTNEQIQAFINNPGRTAQEVYDAAKASGVSASQIESAMGWGDGAVNNWTAQNNLSSLGGAASTTATQQATASYTAPTSAASSPSVPQSYSDDQIKAWISNPGRTAQEVYDAAKINQISGDRIEKVMGWQNGAVNSWTTQNNLDPLSFGNYKDPMKEWAEKEAAAKALAEQEKAAKDAAMKEASTLKEQLALLTKQQAAAVQSGHSLTSGNGNYQTILNSSVDPKMETIEGRMSNLLSTDNAVMRQASDRAKASFASRGLLNSSMAEQGAMEAMISKAVEIAGTDAQKYFQTRTSNVDWANKFASSQQAQDFALQSMATQHQYNKEMTTLQQQFQQQTTGDNFVYSLRNNYLQMTNQVNAMYQDNLAKIQTSSLMTPEEKASAISIAQQMRDNNMSQLNATFEAQPGWVKMWSLSAPTYQ